MLGKCLGVGQTAEVYEWGEQRVIKWFYADYPQASVEQEYRYAMLLQQTDWPTVACYERLLHLGRWGIIYARIAGSSLLDNLLSAVHAGTTAAQLAGEQSVDILADMHRSMLLDTAGVANSRFRRLKEQWGQQLRNAPLPKDVRMQVSRIAEDLPDGHHICHGDFHFGNVMEQAQSPGAPQEQGWIVIDYMNVCVADRLADIARTYYLIAWTPVPPELPGHAALRNMKLVLAERYLLQMQTDREALTPWLIVVAATRLAEVGGSQQYEQHNIRQLLHDWQIWPL